MAVGKISDLVSEQALKQLDDLYAKLGIARNEMVSATEQAAKFNAALADSTSIDNFNKANQSATQAIQSTIAANANLVQSQKAVQVQTQSVADAIKISVTANIEADKLLRDMGGSIDRNSKILADYRAKLSDVNSQLKEISKQYLTTTVAQNEQAAKTAVLTKKQIELKEAISQQLLFLKQQVKETNASAGSQDQMLAKLNELRKLYNTLSEAERNNAQIGGVLLGNIRQLATATTQINQAQGKYNDSVGKYEDAIKSAIASYVPYGNQILKAVDLAKAATSSTNEAGVATAGLGTRFASFTIGTFAVGIAAATYYLQQFRDTAARTEQFMGGLQNQFSNLGSNIVNAFNSGGLRGVLSSNPFKGFVDSFNQGVDVKKQLQEVKNLNEVNDQLVAKRQAEADRDRALSKNKKISSDERIEYLKKAQAIETQIIAMQKDNADANINAAINSSAIVKKLNQGQKDFLREGSEASIQYANQLVQAGKLTEVGYQLLMAGYQKQTQALNSANMKLIRQQTDQANIELKQAKQQNTDALELQKAKLADQQKTAKLILDDNKQSYSARLAALAIYVKRSNDIIDVEQKVADAAPKVSGTQKETNAVKAGSAKKDVAIFDQTEKLKIQKEAVKEFEDLYKDLYQETLHDLQDSLNDQLLAIGNNEAQKAKLLNEQYLKGAVNQKQYQNQLKAINDQANADKIAAEIATEESILAIQTGLQGASGFTGLNIGGVGSKTVQATQNKITGLKTQQINQGIKGGNDDTQTSKDEAIKKAQDIGKAIGDVQQLQNFGEQLLNAQYQQQISLLEQKKQLVLDTANAEIEGVNNSIASAKTKQSQINIINKRAQNDQKQIDEQERKIKHQQAVAQKAFNIASIIENTAVGVSLALAQGGLLFGVPFAAIIGALGAVQLATVLAQPIPQFEKGGTVGKSGPIITGEAGTELRIDPTGAMSLTAPYANLSHAQAGTKIISNKELMRMVGKPEPVMFVGGQATDMREVEKLLKENNDLQKQNRQQKQKINVNVNADWSAYTNKYFN